MKIVLIGSIYLFALIQGLHSYEEPTLFPFINETSNSRIKRRAPVFPREMTMNVIAGFDSNFAVKHGGENEAIKELRKIFTISQTHFYHESLKTRVKLNVVTAKYYRNERWQVTYTVKEKLRRFTTTNSDIHANVFFTSGSTYGLDGLSYSGSVCGPTTKRVSIVKDGGSTSATAGALSKQLGHTLGMKNDEFDGTIRCNGIMGFGDRPMKWSTCSVNDFKNYFDNNQPFCLSSLGTAATTCRNSGGFCDYLEKYWATSWYWVCNKWSGRRMAKDCLKYCRRC